MARPVRDWIIFLCPHDHSIVVSKLEAGIATGVAECPDMITARAVRCAMETRDKMREAADGDATEAAE